MNNDIIIIDWAGNITFEGDCNDEQVDKVLDANRCNHCYGGQILSGDTYSSCKECDESGYRVDFEVYWANSSDNRNVYEFINY